MRSIGDGEMECPTHGFVYGDIPNDKFVEFEKTRKKKSGEAKPARRSRVDAAGFVADANRGASGSAAAMPAVVRNSEANEGVVGAGVPPRRRGFTNLPSSSSRGVRDVSAFRIEDEYVNAEMERRGYQRTAYGQWVGGHHQPGDPEDDRELEAFLRRQYLSMSLSASASAWGQGKVARRDEESLQ